MATQGQAKVVFKIEGLKDSIKSLEDARKALTALQKQGVAVSNKLSGSEFGEAQIAELKEQLDSAGVAYQQLAEDIDETEAALDGLNEAASVNLNTLAALEDRAGELSESLRTLDIGSAAFNKTKQELEAVEQRLEAATISAEESQLVFAELGSKAAATFTIGAGLAASFAAENEDVQQALLIVQQAVAAVELIKNATETAQIARKAEQIEREQKLQKELQKTAIDQRELNAAQGEGAGATGKASKASGGFAGVLKGLFTVIKGSPLIALGGIILGLGAAVVALSGKFKPLALIVEATEDAFGGLVQVFKDVSSGALNLGDSFSALGSIITDSLAVAGNAIKGGFLSIFQDSETAFADFNKSVDEFGTEAGEIFGKSFAKGVERTRALRLNEQQRALNDLTDGAAAIEEALTGSTRAGENARTAIRQRELAEDKKLAEERLQLEAGLSDEELRIIKSGNVEKIKEIKKIVDERGRVNEEVLGLLKEFEAAQTALIQEQEAARLIAIQDRIAAIDATLAVEQARLANIDNFANKALDAEARYTAEVEKLALRRQAGEFKSLKEIETERARIDQERLNEIEALSREQLAFERELQMQRAEIQAGELERQFEEGTRLRTLDFDEQVSLINRIRDLRTQSIDAEFAALDLRRTEDQQKAIELDAERAALAIETNDRVREAAVTAAEQIAEARTAELDIAAKLLDLERQRADLSNTQAQADIDAANASLERASQLTTNLKNATADYQQTLKLIADQQEQNTAEIERQLVLDTEALDLQIETLDVELQRVQALKEAGEIGAGEAARLRANLETQKQILQEQQEGLTIKAEIAIEVNEREAEKQAEDALKGYANFVSGYLKGPVAAEISQALNNAFGVLGPLINELGTQVAQQALEVVAALNAAQLARIDEEITATEQRVTEAQALLDELTVQAEESSTKIQELSAAALASTGEQQSAILAQLNSERAERDKLAKSQKQQAAEARKLVQQQIALEQKRADIEKKQRQQQKAFQIANAIANTAVGITRTIAEVPKVDFGISTAILIALYAALGAAQVASIAAQPARDGGLLSRDGGLIKMRKGGMISGPSHERGGVRGTGSFAGIEVEGGEAIIPKAAVVNNRAVVEALIKQGPTQKLRDGTLELMPSNPQMMAAATAAQSSEQVDQLNANINALADRRVVVAVTDIAEASNRVGVIDSASAI